MSEKLSRNLTELRYENQRQRLQIDQLRGIKRDLAAARALLADVFYFYLSEPVGEDGEKKRD